VSGAVVPRGGGGRRRRLVNVGCREWDRQCAFCGCVGQLAGATVGIDAAHVRWFAFDGPDEPDNGLALCSLHHKLFDFGVLGLDDGHRIRVSSAPFSVGQFSDRYWVSTDTEFGSTTSWWAPHGATGRS
jgi:hypothetical protein